MFEFLIAAPDHQMAVLREWLMPVPACAAPIRTRTDNRPEPWTVVSTSVTYMHSWTGDVPLVTDQAISDGIVTGIRIDAALPVHFTL